MAARVTPITHDLGAGEGYEIACDVGGTFIDIVVRDLADGRTASVKFPTPSTRPASGLLTALDSLEQAVGEPVLPRAVRIVHGTTLVINALLRRKGANVALVTTPGFGDTLHLRRHVRPDIYSIHSDPARPLVNRAMVREVPERTYSDGRVLVELDEAALRQAALELGELGAESVAVCFLHAYRNDGHERRARAVLEEALRPLPVSVSSEIVRRSGEFERMSTVVANAYVRPLIQEYLDELVEGLAARGCRDRLVVMFSNGGLNAVSRARLVPIHLLESGPVGGALCAQHWLGAVNPAGEQAPTQGRFRGATICFDMGGTTAKAALLLDGDFAIAEEYEIGRTYLQRPGSGIPVAIPSLDIVEVGMGGGSLAHVDEGGDLRIGPDSAGADPGPACYQRGGRQPTVTDADLLAGHVHPDDFSNLAVSAEPAERAIREHVAVPLGVSLERAVVGVIEMANEEMADALKDYLATRGIDPVECTMLAVGGGGPVHAYDVARRVGVRTLAVPPMASVGSAYGFLSAAPRVDLLESINLPLSADAGGVLATALERVRAEADAELARLNPRSKTEHHVFLDVSYQGQGRIVRLALPEQLAAQFAEPGGAWRAAVRELFEGRYTELYGRCYPDIPLMLSAVRIQAVVDEQRAVESAEATAAPDPAPPGERSCYSHVAGRFVPFTVRRRHDLVPGEQVHGPLLVQDHGTTTVLDEGGAAHVTDDGVLIIRVGSPHD